MTENSSIAALLARWLPGCAPTFERASSGGSTEVYRVQVGSETTWLRLAEDPGEDRSVEYAVHDRLRTMGVHVPEILMFEVAPPELDRSAALTGNISGIPLTECRDQEIVRRVARAAGEDLALINSLTVEGFGWIDRMREGDPEIVAEHPSRANWANEYSRAIEKLGAAEVFPEDIMPRVVSTMKIWCATDTGSRSHLVHGDFDATHIYFDQATSTYTGIIDFGEGRGADFEYDLGHALLHDGETGRPPIAAAVALGWANGAPDPEVSQRAQVQAIAIGTRQLARMLDRGPSAYADWLTRRVTEIARNA